MLGIGDAAKKLKDKAKAMAMKKMMDKQMSKMSPQERMAVMKMVEDNPEFFQNMAKEIEAEVKTGKNQIAAAMHVMKKHQAKMQELMMKSAGAVSKMSNRNLK